MKKTLIGLLFLLVVLLAFCSCGKKDAREEINLNEYLIVNATGFDGYGTATVSIDVERLVYENSKLLVSTPTTISTQEGKSPAEAAIFVFDMYQPYSLKYNESDSLKNGDVLFIEWIENEEGLSQLQSLFNAKFTHKNIKHEVVSLIPILEVDPFENVYLELSGANGQGAIDLSMSQATVKIGDENYIFAVSIADLKDGGYKNGDTVRVQLEVDEEKLKQEYGFILKTRTREITLDGFSHYPGANEDIFDSIDYQTVNKAFAEHIKATVSESATFKIKKVLLYVNETTEKKEESWNWHNQIVFIYEITDGDLIFYQYFMPNRNIYVGYTFDIDSMGRKQIIVLDTLESLSESSADYIRQTVYEGVSRELTFSANGKKYAGSKSLDKAEALCQKFGITNTAEYYDHKLSYEYDD
jgi:hypothetical protein